MIALTDVAETVVDPKAYADGRIHEAFRWLRREAPFAKLAPTEYDPFWAVTRHADIMEVELKTDLFCSSQGLPGIMPRKVLAKFGERPLGFRTIVSMDGAEHTAYRRLSQSELAPAKLRPLENRIREVARRFIDKMAATGGHCDFAKDIAFLYPLRILMELLGAPESDLDFWLGLTQTGDIQKMLGEDGVDDNARGEAMTKFFGRVMEYFSAVLTDRRQCPRHDLASVVANGRVNGQLIGDMEAIGYYIVFATAGHETTSASTAGGMGALAENSDQFAKLRADPALIPSFVEESIRWVTPVKHFVRTATADTEFAGQCVTKGDKLLLCYVSGTRDEEAFTDPFRFDVGRTPNRHVAFGYGPHVCVGAHLARMEMRIFWEELLPRLQSVELDAPIVHPATIGIAGPSSVPIRFKMN